MVSEEEVLVLSLKKTTAVGSYRDGHKPRSEMEAGDRTFGKYYNIMSLQEGDRTFGKYYFMSFTRG